MKAMVSVKRFVDAVVAITGLVVVSPVLLVVAVGIVLTSRGPVFHRAQRIGKDRRRSLSGERQPERRQRKGYGGREFTMYKFRTMHVAANERSGGPITRRNDSRVYPFGRILRATKIDELPQLINVLRGDMALVGPRPEAPEIVRNHYDADELETLRVPPGITSPGTVHYYTYCESMLTAEAVVDQYVRELLPIKLALDRVYIRHASILYDFRIIIRTIMSVAAKVTGGTWFPEAPEFRELHACGKKQQRRDHSRPMSRPDGHPYGR